MKRDVLLRAKMGDLIAAERMAVIVPTELWNAVVVELRLAGVNIDGESIESRDCQRASHALGQILKLRREGRRPDHDRAQAYRKYQMVDIEPADSDLLVREEYQQVLQDVDALLRRGVGVEVGSRASRR